MRTELVVVGARGSGPGREKSAFGIFFGDNDNRNTGDIVNSKNSKMNAELVASIRALEFAIGDKSLKTLVIVTSNNSIVRYAADGDVDHFNQDFPNGHNREAFEEVTKIFKKRGGKVYWINPEDPRLNDLASFEHLVSQWNYIAVGDYDGMTKITKKIRNALEYFDEEAFKIARKAQKTAKINSRSRRSCDSDSEDDNIIMIPTVFEESERPF